MRATTSRRAPGRLALRAMDDPRPIIGIVGAGQLARMCLQAAIGLDIDLRVLAARPDDPAARIMAHPAIGAADDPAALHAFADGCDVITLDHEVVDGDALAAIEARGGVVRPGSAALRFAQDKAYQRATFRDAGLPVPAFAVIADRADTEDFADEHGWPIVCKRPRGGYDGRGVWSVADRHELAGVWDAAAAGRSAVLVEETVDIACELAVLVARRPGGRHVVAPVVETVQADAMLHELLVPARVPAEVAAEATALAVRVCDTIAVVGVCAVELFWTGQRLLINEVATRPHNSGHWTIDAATTSQFANHLRAVADWPLGAMQPIAPAVCTVNVVGAATAHRHLPDALAVDGVAVHLYGKQPRPGRKLGHVTATGDDVEQARARAHAAADALGPAVDAPGAAVDTPGPAVDAPSPAIDAVPTGAPALRPSDDATR